MVNKRLSFILGYVKKTKPKGTPETEENVISNFSVLLLVLRDSCRIGTYGQTLYSTGRLVAGLA